MVYHLSLLNILLMAINITVKLISYVDHISKFEFKYILKFAIEKNNYVPNMTSKYFTLRAQFKTMPKK
jgi:hypothetical protein